VPTSNAQGRGDARRRELLEATLRVVARGGVGAVTHRVVAREAGVPLGSTTYYFKTKEDMVAQALELVAERETSAIATFSASRFEAASSVDGLIEVLVETMMRGIARDSTEWVAEYELFIEAIRRPELQPVARRWTDAQVAALQPALERLGVARVESATRLLVAGLDGLALEFMAEGKPREELPPLIEDLVRRIVGVLPSGGG
jgi:DNA-binding transcriptional regulator YbjK